MTDFGPRHIHEAIARASLDPNAWRGVTDAILSTFPGSKPAILRYESTGARAVPSATSGHDPSFRSSYEAHYGRVVPWMDQWTSLPLGQVVYDWDIMPSEELVRSELYNDWLRPQDGLRHGILAVLQRDPSRRILFAARVEKQLEDQVLPGLMRLTRDLYPLMQHGLEVNRMTLGLRLDAAVLRHGAEPDGATILLLGEQGTILYANARAEALLSEGHLIRHDPLGRLRFTDGEAMMRLGSALDPRSRSIGAAFRIRSSQPPQEVRLMQVSSSTMDQVQLPMLMQGPTPRLLLVLRPAVDPSEAALRVAPLLGLTRAETEVALAITEGATIAEVAEARGVSVHTIREQVKSALAKTGARRQSDLVRMVSGLRHAY